jgi:hypothetical protein
LAYQMSEVDEGDYSFFLPRGIADDSFDAGDGASPQRPRFGPLIGIPATKLPSPAMASASSQQPPPPSHAASVFKLPPHPSSSASASSSSAVGLQSAAAGGAALAPAPAISSRHPIGSKVCRFPPSHPFFLRH